MKCINELLPVNFYNINCELLHILGFMFNYSSMFFFMQLYWMFNKTIALICKDIILQWKTKKLMTKFTFSSTSVFLFFFDNELKLIINSYYKIVLYIKIIHNTRFNMN